MTGESWPQSTVTGYQGKNVQRVAEPELMNDKAQALAYAEADFAAPHDYFIELFQQAFPNRTLNCTVLDLGCGPADISIRFAKAYPQCRIHGIDGARAMLHYGRQAIREHGVADRIELIEAYLPGAKMPCNQYDVIISNSLLHHLADPTVLWQSISAYADREAMIFIMDLMRPESKVIAQQLVDEYAAEEPTILKKDFYHSLLAAYTVKEIKQQLIKAKLTRLDVQSVSDRHLIIQGCLG